MVFPGSLAIKVDVDTLEGFRQGVPALIKVLADHAVKASFFLALGPDHSGRAIFRIFRQRGFLEKMWRTRAPALYGFKTMCYGTLLPGPKIGAAAPHLAPQLAAAGHEVGLHGYDHVRWHDHLYNLSPEKVAREIDRAQADLYGADGKTRLLLRRSRVAVRFEQPHHAGGPEFSLRQ